VVEAGRGGRGEETRAASDGILGRVGEKGEGKEFRPRLLDIDLHFTDAWRREGFQKERGGRKKRHECALHRVIFVDKPREEKERKRGKKGRRGEEATGVIKKAHAARVTHARNLPGKEKKKNRRKKREGQVHRQQLYLKCAESKKGRVEHLQFSSIARKRGRGKLRGEGRRGGVPTSSKALVGSRKGRLASIPCR